MKQLLVFISFLFVIILFEIPEEINSMGEVIPTQESIMKENPSSTQQSIEILSKELKTSTCLTPRRTLQVVNTTSHARTIHHLNKMLRVFRLKSEEQLCKISQVNSYRQTIKIYTLLCRKGYHVYALRKIII